MADPRHPASASFSQLFQKFSQRPEPGKPIEEPEPRRQLPDSSGRDRQLAEHYRELAQALSEGNFALAESIQLQIGRLNRFPEP